MTEGRPCKAEGRRHDHEVGIRNEPKVVHAAIMAPEYHRELYKEVSGALYGGYAISETNIGAAFVAKVNPNPIKKL